MAEPLELTLLDSSLDYLKEYTHPKAISLCISNVQQIVEDLKAEAVRLCVKLTDFSEDDVFSFDAQWAISIANGCQFAEADSAFSALSKIIFMENSVADFQELGAGYFYRDDFLAEAEDFIKLIYRARIQVDDAARLASSKGRTKGSKAPKHAVAIYALFKKLRKENPIVSFSILLAKAKQMRLTENKPIELEDTLGISYLVYGNPGTNPEFPPEKYSFIQVDSDGKQKFVADSTLEKRFRKK